MAAAIILGLLSGILGFVPLAVGLHMTKKVTETSNFGHMAILMLGLIISFVILFAAAVICVLVARDIVLYFVLSEAISLCLVTIGFGISRVVRK
ncbi:MAG: hypothetical protein IKV48_04705 [Eggerthellaceae bacterium]|nr:hypothetical protein [Eggerthellaceae bacterium]